METIKISSSGTPDSSIPFLTAENNRVVADSKCVMSFLTFTLKYLMWQFSYKELWVSYHSKFMDGCLDQNLRGYHKLEQCPRVCIQIEEQSSLDPIPEIATSQNHIEASMGLLYGQGGHSVSVDDMVSDTYMLISTTQERHHFFSFAFRNNTHQPTTQTIHSRKT